VTKQVLKIQEKLVTHHLKYVTAQRQQWIYA